MKSALTHILVIDDDSRLRGLIKKYLTENNFIVVSAENAAKAREVLKSLKFDIIVLDVMMPNETGIKFLETLRKTSQIPVLMLTAQGEPVDRISGLETGADDYLTKPFEPKELVLRIKSILKRQQVSQVITIGKFTFDAASGSLKSGNVGIHLTSAEEDFLKILAQNAGKPVSRANFGPDLNERSIDVQINRLRKKIEDDPKKPVYIQSVRGIGYKLNV